MGQRLAMTVRWICRREQVRNVRIHPPPFSAVAKMASKTSGVVPPRNLMPQPELAIFCWTVIGLVLPRLFLTRKQISRWCTSEVNLNSGIRLCFAITENRCLFATTLNRQINQALNQEFQEVIQQAKQMAAANKQPSELWELEHHLTQRRKEINQKYEYRASKLTFVFGTLLHEGRLTEQGLRPSRRQTGRDPLLCRFPEQK
jgi:hypothetical protein